MEAEAEAEVAALAAAVDSTAAFTEDQDPRIITIIITDGDFTVRTDIIITAVADALAASLA